MAVAKFSQEAVDRSAVRPAAGHRPVVEVEMAGKPTPPVVVTFLGQNDLVDEPTAERINGGQPRDFDAAEPPLQGLEQGHEIPHGEGVVFHEQAQRVQPVDLLVDGMVQQCGLERRETFLNVLKSIHRGLFFLRGTFSTGRPFVAAGHPVIMVHRVF